MHLRNSVLKRFKKVKGDSDVIQLGERNDSLSQLFNFPKMEKIFSVAYMTLFSIVMKAFFFTLSVKAVSMSRLGKHCI